MWQTDCQTPCTIMSENRRSSVLHVGGFRPTKSPLASHFGLQPLALTDEDWPLYNGSPMLFVCQLNLTTAPSVPSLLADLQLITFFVEPETCDMSRQNGEGWCLRAYGSLDGLVPLDPPPDTPSFARGFECRWEQAADSGSDPAGGTKIGGYLSEIQSEPWWELEAHPADPQFCLQIDSEEKVGLMWGDSGTVYLARGAAPGCQDRWFLDWQCY